ncbi:hypothetical protein WOLCODRAFT_83835, partial [Wolfiporia cocos MD-104 SS10]
MDENLINHLCSLSSSQLKQRLTRIPLVPGMRVLVSQNFDVHGGVVNGSVGILKSIRYTLDQNNRRHLKSCIVSIPDATADTMPHLEPGDHVILEDTV